MDEKKLKIIGIIVAILGIWCIGFFLGRKYSEPKEVTVTKYVKGDTITDTLYKPVPYKVKEPVDTADIIKECIKNGYYSELFPEKEIIVEVYKPTSEDTLAIINDWATKRFYTDVLFDNDTTGKLEVSTDVQYNRVTNMNYTFTPIYKEITNTIYKEPIFSPFVGAGVGYTPFVSLHAGAFIKEKHGVSLMYLRDIDNKQNYWGINYFYKF